MEKRERIAEFLRRLAVAPPAANREEALAQVVKLMNAVEDELSGLPYDAAFPRDSERMYAPQEDSRMGVADHDEVVRYRSKAHHTFIRQNGAIEIRLARYADGSRAWPPQTGPLLLKKPGRDGKGVWEP